jgi:hypothetical protein
VIQARDHCPFGQRVYRGPRIGIDLTSADPVVTHAATGGVLTRSDSRTMTGTSRKPTRAQSLTGGPGGARTVLVVRLLLALPAGGHGDRLVAPVGQATAVRTSCPPRVWPYRRRPRRTLGGGGVGPPRRRLASLSASAAARAWASADTGSRARSSSVGGRRGVARWCSCSAALRAAAAWAARCWLPDPDFLASVLARNRMMLASRLHGCFIRFRVT